MYTMPPMLVSRSNRSLESVTPNFAQPAPAPRRRASPSQGRALEALGHAVEYLVDSRLFTLDESAAASDAAAAQLLMRASRAVFAECPEVISLQRRLRLWLVDRLTPQLEAHDAL